MPKKFVILFERACIYSLYRRQESFLPIKDYFLSVRTSPLKHLSLKLKIILKLKKGKSS